MNKVEIIGRLTKDPEVRASGESSVVRFTVAVDRRFKRNGDEQTADFLNCVAFSKTADFISKYFTKGMRIGFTGRIQTGTYTDKDGNRRTSFDIIAEECEFVESKNSQQNTQPAQTSSVANDGFMNLPDDISELPFN